MLLEAARQIPEALFIFTGGLPEVVAAFRVKTEEMGITNVRFTGFLPSLRDPLAYMRAADVLLSFYSSDTPTLRHMVPNKIIQYARSGTPIVSADYPAIRFMLGDEGAIYVEPENVGALAGAIRGLMTGHIDGRGNAAKVKQALIGQGIDDRARAILGFFIDGTAEGKAGHAGTS